MAIEVFNRFEHKYLLTKDVYDKVVEVMDSRMRLDSYNKNHKMYTIANIYYDTSDNYLIRKSLSKPIYKEKLRMRAYGIPNADSKVFLEIKKKFNGIVNKRRTSLILNEAYTFAASGIKPAVKDYMNPQVLNEIEFFLHRYSLFPKLYLAYDRMAYFAKNSPDLRISFDTNIRSRRYDLRLEAGDYGLPLLDENIYLMEIKTSLAKPLWLTNILSQFELRRSSFSKYGLEFTNWMHNPYMYDKIKIAV